jgi:hypothetical protein
VPSAGCFAFSPCSLLTAHPSERQEIGAQCAPYFTHFVRTILVRSMPRVQRINLSRLFSLIAILICGSSLADETPRQIEGVYHLHNGYQSETLELRDGRFRYWFWTDCSPPRGDLPLEGTYSVNGSALTLNRNDILLGNQRIFQPLKGMDALWRPDALERWISKGEISTYGVLVRVPHPPDDLSNQCLPISAEVCAALQEGQRRPK